LTIIVKYGIIAVLQTIERNYIMKLGELVKKLQELETQYGSDTNIEFNIDAGDWSYDEDAVAHEIDQIHDWEDSKNKKWVNIYLR